MHTSNSKTLSIILPDNDIGYFEYVVFSRVK